MPRFCRTLFHNGQAIGIACGRTPDRKCSSCGAFGARQLCDYPVTRNGKAATCDRALCRRCAVRVGPDRDYCPAHDRMAKEAAKGGTP